MGTRVKGIGFQKCVKIDCGGALLKPLDWKGGLGRKKKGRGQGREEKGERGEEEEGGTEKRERVLARKQSP